MADENDRQSEIGDYPDLEPIDELQDKLEQLAEDGELDSDDITFRPTILGGVHLDRIGRELEDVDYERDPVRIVIEPETAHPDDHHYRIEFIDLELVESDEQGREWEPTHHEYVRSDRHARLERLAEQVRTLDALVPSEIAEMDDVGVHYEVGHLTFAVEAEVVEKYGDRGAEQEYRLPEDLRALVSDYDGLSLTECAFQPEGNGWGEPTYHVTLKLDS